MLFAHVRQRALGEEERGAQVDSQRLVEQSGVDFFVGRPPAEPSVRDQHVDRAQGGLDLVHQTPWSCWVGQVGGEDLRLRPGLSY